MSPDQPPVTGGDPKDVWADLLRAYDTVKDAPFRPDHWFDPSLSPSVYPEVRVPLNRDYLALAEEDSDRYVEAMDKALLKAVLNVAEQVNAYLGQCAPLLRHGFTLCEHEDRSRMEHGLTDQLTPEDRVVVRKRIHLLNPGQACAHTPRIQYVGTVVDEAVREWGGGLAP